MVAGSVLAAAALKILFVGNSLTYVHDVPARVARLASSVGVDVEVTMVARPNYSLTDHWQDGEAVRTIKAGGFDVVVLQQGPTAALENRPQLFKEASRFGKLIREHGARPALYMVWPAEARSQDWDGVIASYTTAAKGAQATLLPVGSAWRRVLKHDPPIPLYGDDGFHPTETGSTLAALVIAATLLDRPPRDFPLEGVPQPTANVLKEAAEALTTRASPR
jgi:hypothetical protein